MNVNPQNKNWDEYLIATGLFLRSEYKLVYRDYEYEIPTEIDEYETTTEELRIRLDKIELFFRDYKNATYEKRVSSIVEEILV